ARVGVPGPGALGQGGSADHRLAGPQAAVDVVADGRPGDGPDEGAGQPALRHGINIDPTLPRWLPGGLVLLPGKDGALEVQDAEGQRAEVDTPGPWGYYRALVSLNPRTREVIFVGGRAEDAPEAHLYRQTVPRPGERRIQVHWAQSFTKGPGQYNAVFARNH